jgi:AcrR family transcriptional regulator
VPKRFTAAEKQWIYDKLVEEGKARFESVGLKKTAIEDLTKAVGIAQGTFYTFFQSKEELFFLILMREEEKIRQHLLSGPYTEGRLTKTKFLTFLRDALALLDRSPLLKQLYLEDMEHLLRKLPPNVLEQHLQNDQDVFAPLIVRWQEAGWMKRMDVAVILGMLRALVLLTFQQKLIGEEVYDQTLDAYMQMIAESLIMEEEEQ